MSRPWANVLGDADHYVDPVWRAEVELSPLERELLTTWPVRRLAGVAHAGAAAAVTTQTYSRLEHSLGLLALVARLAPHDHVARAGALLHDIGHTPLSHTLEGLAGPDHHRLTEEGVRSLAPVLHRFGLDAGGVVSVATGRRPSMLRGPAGLLTLDHLESLVRGAHAHGRTREPPADTLARCGVHDGAVVCDAATAADLARLVVDEAVRQTASWNVRAVAVLRHLTEAAMSAAGGPEPEALAAFADHELWSLLLGSPSTADATRELMRHPERWTVEPIAGPADAIHPPTLVHEVARLYVDLPVVDGTRWRFSDEQRRVLDGLPRRFAVARSVEA